ncbi:hypothetical protein KAW80_01460 [Candidatus Babeliales bacterium]|nr:hypothetical protein [Candidatus Babeliales bacterium]
MNTTLKKHLVGVFLIANLFTTTQANTNNKKGSWRFTEKKESVKVSVKTSQNKLLLKEYQPIHFTFTNSSNKKYLLKAENVGLNLLTNKELKKVGKKRFGIIPFTTIFSAQFYTLGQLLAGTLTAAKLPIALPIIIGGTALNTALHQYQIKQINKKEKKVFEELKKGVSIEPYSIRHITLHLKKEHVKPRFDLKVIEENNFSGIRFNINFKPKSQHPLPLNGKKFETDKK